MKILIICNGTISSDRMIREYIRDSSYVICCDGGLRHAHMLDIEPHLLLGDLDSCPEDLISKYPNLEILRYDPKKDVTDLEIAIDHALSLQPNEVVIIGAIGNRFDHTLANAHLLMLTVKNGIKSCIVNENNVVRLTDSTITLSGNAGDLLSLIPLSSEVTGVTTSGLFYPLDNATLSIGSSLGISNVFTSDTAMVSVKDGFLFVIHSWD